MKTLLSVDEIVNHMSEKGITFNCVTKDEFKEFITEHNYYMKLASYRDNYTKNDEGKYDNLDAGYLIELSRLDASLRYLVFHMTSDIEHFIKVRFIREVTDNPDEDGYNIIKGFLSEDSSFRYLKEISKHKASGYCKDLIDKYYPYFPAWVFVELISFGTLSYLCSFYSKKYSTPAIGESLLLNSVRDLRNASAHSNCMLNNLDKWNNENKYQYISNKLGKLPGISKKRKNKQLRNKFVYDFVCLIYAYNIIVPECPSKEHRRKELRKLFFVRMREHSDWFVKNAAISNAYMFLRKMLLTNFL